MYTPQLIFIFNCRNSIIIFVQKIAFISRAKKTFIRFQINSFIYFVNSININLFVRWEKDAYFNFNSQLPNLYYIIEKENCFSNAREESFFLNFQISLFVSSNGKQLLQYFSNKLFCLERFKQQSSVIKPRTFFILIPPPYSFISIKVRISCKVQQKNITYFNLFQGQINQQDSVLVEGKWYHFFFVALKQFIIFKTTYNLS